MTVAKHATLRKLTQEVQTQVVGIKQDEHLEDRVQVEISKARNSNPLSADLYLLHREVLRGLSLIHI